MTVVTVRKLDMKSDASVEAEGAKEFLGQSGIKVADLLVGDRYPVMEKGAVGEIKGYPNQGFIHGEGEMAVAANGAAVAEGLFERLAQADAEIFDGVVVIHLGVAGGVDGEIEKTMNSKKGQHVIHKRNAGGNIGLTGAAQLEGEADVGFFGLAMDCALFLWGGCGHQKTPVWGKVWLFRATVLMTPL